MYGEPWESLYLQSDPESNPGRQGEIQYLGGWTLSPLPSHVHVLEEDRKKRYGSLGRNGKRTKMDENFKKHRSFQVQVLSG